MDKTRTDGQKWLANELDLQFFIIRKCTKFQSNRLILSKVIEYTNTQTESQKPFFLTQGVSKLEDLMKNGGGQFLHKSNALSDENRKIFNAQNLLGNSRYRLVPKNEESVDDLDSDISVKSLLRCLVYRRNKKSNVASQRFYY